MRYGELPVNASAQGLVLYCPECDEAFSADRGDYFAVSPDTEATCSGAGIAEQEQCDTPLVLAKRIPEHYEPVDESEYARGYAEVRPNH